MNEYENKGRQGILYLCATPIGNLEDITFRVLRTLKEVDLIAAEDTRNSMKLCNHFDIKTPLTSYHEFNKYDKAKVLVDKLRAGADIAVITDAGTRRFCFEAFLPSDKQERRDVISELENETRTMIIYEAPHRLKKTLAELTEVFGADRRLSVCKELTKRHENVFLTTFGEVVEFYENNEPRGEYVLVIEGKSRDDIKKEQQAQWESMSIVEHVDKYIADGMDKKEAMKAAAKDRGISKREVYNEYVK